MEIFFSFASNFFVAQYQKLYRWQCRLCKHRPRAGSRAVFVQRASRETPFQQRKWADAYKLSLGIVHIPRSCILCRKKTGLDPCHGVAAMLMSGRSHVFVACRSSKLLIRGRGEETKSRLGWNRNVALNPLLTACSVPSVVLQAVGWGTQSYWAYLKSMRREDPDQMGSGSKPRCKHVVVAKQKPQLGFWSPACFHLAATVV